MSRARLARKIDPDALARALRNTAARAAGRPLTAKGESRMTPRKPPRAASTYRAARRNWLRQPKPNPTRAQLRRSRPNG